MSTYEELVAELNEAEKTYLEAAEKVGSLREKFAKMAESANQNLPDGLYVGADYEIESLGRFEVYLKRQGVWFFNDESYWCKYDEDMVQPLVPISSIKFDNN